MNLRKLPPSMLLALGLACGDKESESDETTVNACLSPPYTTETDTGPCLDVGPCLSETGSFPTSTSTGTSTGTSGSSSGADSTFGPCLSPEPPTSTGTDTGSGTDTDTEGTTGMMGDEPASTRAAAVQRVLERQSLPPDVLDRLRTITEGKG